MALSADRNTPRLTGDIREPGVGAGQKVFAGALVCRNAAGYAVKGTAARGLVGMGRAEAQVDNTGGSNGDVRVRVREGVFRFGNSADGDLITVADIGRVAWVVDDETVAKTSGAATRSPAGIIVDVDTLGVHVLMGEAVLAAIVSLGTVIVQARVTTLVGTGSYYAVAPVAGRVTKIWSVIEGVLTTGNATLTGKINGAAITDGVITITQASSAAGDVDSATPSALNIVAAGDALAVTVGGTNATASAAQVFFEITL